MPFIGASCCPTRYQPHACRRRAGRRTSPESEQRAASLAPSSDPRWGRSTPRVSDASEQVGAPPVRELIDDGLHRLRAVATRHEDRVGGQRNRHVGHADEREEGSFAADHLIARPELLRTAVETAIGAARDGYVVTIGLTPTEASTAYGYIAPGPALADGSGEADAERGARRVAEFVEKPDADTAARYVAAGYLWNAGMFIVSAGVLAAHLARLLPDMHARLETIARAWGTPEFDEVLADNWPHLTKIAIDHAIAEPVAADGGVAVVPADAELGWTDLGDFEALTGIVAEAGHLGEALRVESDGAAVFGSLTKDGAGPLVALVGVPDVAVALTPDAIVVTRRDRAQSVKAVVDQLAEQGRSDLL